MDRQAQRALNMAIDDLRYVSNKLQAIAPDADPALRAELLEMRRRSEAAISYYNGLLARQSQAKVPSVADRVAQAAFGGSGVGLVLPQFAIPSSSADPRP